MASFSSPNWISSPSLLSNTRALSRSATVWRSASGMARPPYGCVTRIVSSSSGCCSKNFGLVRRKRATSSGLIVVLLEVDGSVIHRFGRALQPDRIVDAGPRDGQRSAAGFDQHRRIEQLPGDARYDGGASAGPARERLTRAALPDTQSDAAAAEHLHIAGVDAIGK